MRTMFWIFFLLFSCSGFLSADLSLPSIFSDNMVLQRDKELRVWGWAAPGAEVRVSLGNSVSQAVADADGKWLAVLAPQSAGGPYELIIKGDNTVKFNNVMLGEVWICSGQSNMEWRTQNVDNAEAELQQADYPDIRLFQGNTYAISMARQTDIPGKKWVPCGRSSVAGFSAVAYFFGRKLHQELQVPIGLINVSWGGTRIEPWISEYGFSTQESLQNIYQSVQVNIPGSAKYLELTPIAIAAMESWLKGAQAAFTAGRQLPDLPVFPEGIRLQNNRQPTVLFNNMIAPLTPFQLRGMLWYQGCSNMGDNLLYRDKMHALAAGWRHEFQNPVMPLYFVQLAPYNYGDPYRLPQMWEAQQLYADEDAFAGMAVINDIGNFKDIHPRNKQDVGNRLALLALKRDYGKQNVVAESPFFQELLVENDKLIVRFRNASKLATKDGKKAKYFEIAGADGIFQAAEAELRKNEAILSNSAVAVPYSVRYAWRHDVSTNLVNENQLPAGAFQASLEIPVRLQLDRLVPEAKEYQVLYAINPFNAWNGRPAYMLDNREKVNGKVKKIAYFLCLHGVDQQQRFVFAAMDPFTQDLKQLALPNAAAKIFFQQKVENLFVNSNVTGVTNGNFADGNLELWSGNYQPSNQGQVPGASDQQYDFGDSGNSDSDGYACMQLHNYQEKQTIFAFNNFRAAKNADLGIGNNASGHPDYTFSKSGQKYQSAQLLILVKTE
ncbi:MAG: sialate O-acetylesterase [Lentisphaeria bacterium]